jgi:hypothetical protein
MPQTTHAQNYGYGYYTTAQHHGYPSYSTLWCERKCVLRSCVRTNIKRTRTIDGRKIWKLFRLIFIFRNKR